MVWGDAYNPDGPMWCLGGKCDELIAERGMDVASDNSYVRWRMEWRRKWAQTCGNDGTMGRRPAWVEKGRVERDREMNVMEESSRRTSASMHQGSRPRMVPNCLYFPGMFPTCVQIWLV